MGLFKKIGNALRKTRESIARKIDSLLSHGELDDDFIFARYLKAFESDNLEVITIPGADHRFRGMLEDFVALADLI